MSRANFFLTLSVWMLIASEHSDGWWGAVTAFMALANMILAMGHFWAWQVSNR